SSAAFLTAAALLVPGSHLTIAGVGLNETRCGLFATLAEMGADIAVENRRVEGGEPVGDLVVSHSPLRGAAVPWGHAPTMYDDYRTLAGTASCAVGPRRRRGLRGVRVRESARVAAPAALLAVNGVRVEVEGDDLIVHGDGSPPAGGGLVATDMDHRIAMAGL